MTQPATTQELIADVLIPYFGDEIAYTAAAAVVLDPAITVRPRVVISGEWWDVKDALDALPEGTQIRWQTGDPIHPALAIKTLNVMGQTRWSTTENIGYDYSESIARDNTPIEVIA